MTDSSSVRSSSVIFTHLLLHEPQSEVKHLQLQDTSTHRTPSPKWLRRIWAGRARVDPQWWRLYFVVVVDGRPVGMQDLTGTDFAAFGTVSTFSWLEPGMRHRGFGTEMRSAILHLAFAGLD